MTVANQAIFQLQLNTNEAIKFVVTHAGISAKEASQAIKDIMISYK